MLGENVNQVNQILPHKNKWAWDLYLMGCSNNWMPTEVSMQKDVEQWKSNKLTDDEKLLIKRCLGFFACSESLIGNNILLAIYKFVNDGECRQYLGRQLFEESLHALTVVYCCDSLNLDIKEIYEAYDSIQTIVAKDNFLIKHTAALYDRDFDITTYDGQRLFIKNLFIYYLMFEGLLFYNSFAALLSMKRRGLMPGIGEQIEYTLRDEASHVKFGTTLINMLQKDHKIFPEEEALSILKEVLELENGYINEMIPNGLFGFNKEDCFQYIKFIANRRFVDIGFAPPFPSVSENPFNWLSETLDLPKMKNFFESRVIEYKTAGLVDDL